MTRLRRALGVVAAVWLFCQVVAVALAPIAVATASTDGSAAECTCTHGENASCPMHHKRASGSTICVMQNATGEATVLLTTLFGLAGLTSPPVVLAVPVQPGRVALTDPQMIAAHPTPPDPPPPRA
jgi:hypothetical protein